MREIKFRVWITKESEAHESYYGMHYASFEDICVAIEDDSGVPINVQAFNLWKGKYMRYIGLKDKKGKEIYEGDIVKNLWRKETVVIEWDDEVTGFTQQRDNKYYTHLFMDWSKDLKTEINLEVIGNIWENPELLKEA